MITLEFGIKNTKKTKKKITKKNKKKSFGSLHWLSILLYTVILNVMFCMNVVWV